MIQLPDQIVCSYSALMDGDVEVARRSCSQDLVCHVGGSHPLSGDYHGITQIVDVVRRMGELGGQASFTPTNVMTDDTGTQMLLEGVAMHGSFARHVINRLRYEDDQLTELWIRPLDQRAEDDFWTARVPHQRAGR